jgi:hypothetical protein
MKNLSGEENARNAGLRWLVRPRFPLPVAAIYMRAAYWICQNGIRFSWVWIAACVAIGKALNLYAIYRSSSSLQNLPKLVFGGTFSHANAVLFSVQSPNSFCLPLSFTPSRLQRPFSPQVLVVLIQRFRCIY